VERKGFIGGSDAKRILDGDWHSLWQEKTGLKQPENLDHNFQVQLGVRTEDFHLRWLNKYHDFDIIIPPADYRSRRMDGKPFITALLDGWERTQDTFVEVKHSNARADRESMIQWYQPQVAHYCNVVGKEYGWLSYIAGNASPDFFKIEPSKAYREALLELELAFWWHVENNVPPVLTNAVDMIDKAVIEAAAVKIDDMRVVDMTGHNEWASMAADYQLNKDTAAAFEKAKAGLKKLVEKDVRLASGHGITIKRSKSGSLLFGGE